jgi:hypothetical protein
MAYLATAGADNSVVILDCRSSFREVYRWSHHDNCIYSMCAIGDGCIFTGDGMGMMLCYDIIRGELKYGLGACQNGAVRSIHCIDGKIVCGGEDGRAMVYAY